MRMKAATVLLLTLVLAGTGVHAGEKEAKEVKKAIQEGIKLLEQDKTKEFLEQYIHPEEAKKGNLVVTDEFIKRFEQRKKAEILRALKDVVDKAPHSSSETMVTYSFKKGNRERFMNFMMYKGKWYISNKNSRPVKEELKSQ